VKRGRKKKKKKPTLGQKKEKQSGGSGKLTSGCPNDGKEFHVHLEEETAKKETRNVTELLAVNTGGTVKGPHDQLIVEVNSESKRQ